MNIDFYIFQQINQFAGQNVCFDGLAIFFAEYFEYILIFCLLLFLIKNFKKYLPMVLQSLVAAVLARLVIVDFIRWIWARPRPFIENQVNLLLSHELTPSFPSGHTAFYFALSTVIYFYNKKAGISFFIASFLIAISRVFCGVHWPSDILAGAAVGIFSGWFIILLSRKFFSIEKKQSLR